MYERLQVDEGIAVHAQGRHTRLRFRAVPQSTLNYACQLGRAGISFRVANVRDLRSMHAHAA